jgi:hypothetical protein
VFLLEYGHLIVRTKASDLARITSEFLRPADYKCVTEKTIRPFLMNRFEAAKRFTSFSASGCWWCVSVGAVFISRALVQASPLWLLIAGQDCVFGLAVKPAILTFRNSVPD